MELVLSFVQLHIEEGVAHLLLHRPEKHNALSRELIDDIHQALDVISQHENSVRVMVLSGAGGKAFAAGADIAELEKRTRNDAFLGINSRLFLRIEQLPMPTIAAIEGFCLGGGCELALACDLRVASRKSRFGQPEVGLGIVAGAGATFRLARLVGLGRARELLFTGRVISAEEAARIGLVETLVDDGLALEEAFATARLIAQKAPLAIRLTKTLLNSYGRQLAGENQLIAELSQAILFESEDKIEGMRSFLEKRSPEWKGN